jgi:drug/metabolite transporter (DMT)-like permease
MKKNNDFALGVLFSLINSVSLGILGVIDKIGAEHFTSTIVFSTQSVFFSYLFVSLFAIFFFRTSFLVKAKTIPFSTLKYIFLVGIFASGLFVLFRFLGLTQSTGTFATLGQVIITAETAILALIFLQEKLSGKFWLLFVIVLIAIYFVSVGAFKLTPLHAGDTFIIIGATFVAIANIFSKLAVNKINPILLTEGRFFFGLLFLLLTTLLFFHNTNLLTFSIWSILSGLFWAVNVTAFNFAIKKIGVTLATSLLMTAPIYTMIFEYFILKQTFNLLQIISALVVVTCGVLMVVLKDK